MLSAEVTLRKAQPAISFDLPRALEANLPPEVRGGARDDVRLMVSTPSGIIHQRFRRLAEFLRSGDLLVVNTSATIPAALSATREDGTSFMIHLSTRLPAGLSVVEPRNVQGLGREHLRLDGGGHVDLLAPYLGSHRLWIARFELADPLLVYLGKYGKPITYRHSSAEWPLETYQNVYACEPGSAEMASAGRPITFELLSRLRNNGVEIASLVLHAGVSSPEAFEPPYEEEFDVPAETALAVGRVRRHGGRIIAVGTTVVRALESSLDARGRVVAARGWTDLVVTPQRGITSVDGILTGFHEPKSSHLAMLETIAGERVVRESYAAALERGYLWHEFGDSHLLMKTR